MAKDAAKNKQGRSPFVTTIQTETYRQRLKREENIMESRNKADMDKLDHMFGENNDYFHIIKRDQQAKNLAHSSFVHPLDQMGNNNKEQTYSQKTAKDTVHDLTDTQRLEQQAQELLKVPLTSSQSYGWRSKIDDTNFGYGYKKILQPTVVQARGDASKAEKK